MMETKLENDWGNDCNWKKWRLYMVLQPNKMAKKHGKMIKHVGTSPD